MLRNSKRFVLILIVLLAACSDSKGPKPQYTITLTEVALSKKGSGEPLPASGLPAHGATLSESK